jgi:hypothetical protein
MKELTKKQKQTLDKLNQRIAEQNEEWIATYCELGGESGHVTVLPGTVLEELWNELVASRTKRNELLAQYRAEGRNI